MAGFSDGAFDFLTGGAAGYDGGSGGSYALGEFFEEVGGVFDSVFGEAVVADEERAAGGGDGG